MDDIGIILKIKCPCGTVTEVDFDNKSGVVVAWRGDNEFSFDCPNEVCERSYDFDTWIGYTQLTKATRRMLQEVEK